MSSISVDALAAERLAPDQRDGTLPRLGVTWSGVLLSPTPVIGGIVVTASMEGIGYPRSLIGLVLGFVVGSAAVAWLSTWGPRTGLGQMAISTLAFGRGNVVPQAFLVVSLIAYSPLTLPGGGSALTTAVGIPLWLGVLLAGCLQLVVGLVGLRLLERLGLVITGLMALVVLVLAIDAFGQMPPPSSSPAGVTLIGGIFLGLALGLGNSYSWSVQASDLSRNLREKTPAWATFTIVFVSMVVPLTLLAAIGARIATVAAVDAPMERMYTVLGGGLLAVLALLAMGMALAAENSYNDLSNVLTLESWGIRWPRRIVSATLTLTAVLLTFLIAGNSLGELTENAIVVAGYFNAPWFGVMAWEMIRRRHQVRPWLVPARNAWSGAVSFLVSYAVLLMFTSTPVGDSLAMTTPLLGWIGIAPRMGFDGVELGYLAGTAVAFVMYAALSKKSREPISSPG